MERPLTVEFGPSHSKRFGRAVALAQAGPGECAEVEPGRYRVTFLLSREPALYGALGRLLERVRHWRATEVSGGDGPVSTYHAKEMAWCASFQLSSFGECRERFHWGVLPRCGLCPLFNTERAIRAGLMAQFEWDLPEWVELSPLIPDFPPEEWPDIAPDDPTR